MHAVEGGEVHLPVPGRVGQARGQLEGPAPGAADRHLRRGPADFVVHAVPPAAVAGLGGRVDDERLGLVLVQRDVLGLGPGEERLGVLPVLPVLAVRLQTRARGVHHQLQGDDVGDTLGGEVRQAAAERLLTGATLQDGHDVGDADLLGGPALDRDHPVRVPGVDDVAALPPGLPRGDLFAEPPVVGAFSVAHHVIPDVLDVPDLDDVDGALRGEPVRDPVQRKDRFHRRGQDVLERHGHHGQQDAQQPGRRALHEPQPPPALRPFFLLGARRARCTPRRTLARVIAPALRAPVPLRSRAPRRSCVPCRSCVPRRSCAMGRLLLALVCRPLLF